MLFRSFNAWGGKYEEQKKDGRIFTHHASRIEAPCVEADFVFEGGSIDVNGQGACLTTEQCLLNPNRNPRLSRLQIEKNLKDYLGVSEIVWLKKGIEGDDTDGHVDDIARFVNEDTMVLAYEEDSSDANAKALQENGKRLKDYIKENQKDWVLIRLPMPGKIANGEGKRLPASYADFYIANETVLLPVYSHPRDQRAIDLLTELFPSRTVVPIECTALVQGLGAIHCATQQEPS